MTDRNKLIELITEFYGVDPMYYGVDVNALADYLLANGVIVPPCKVGDKLYIVANVSQEIVESIVIGIWLADGVFSLLSIHGTILTDNLGKTIFLTKEGAEAELEKRGKEND